MSKKSLLSEEFIKEAIKLLTLLVINFYLNKEVFTSEDINGQFATVMVSIIGFVIYFLLSSIIRAARKPLLLEVDLKNKLTSKNTTEIIHHNMSREESRTILMKISVTKKDSLWTKFALWFLKSKSIKCKIVLDPPDDNFLCRPSVIANEVIQILNTFEVNIKELISSSLNSSTFTFTRSYNVVINENKTNPPQVNCNLIIKPVLLLDNKELNVVSKMLIQIIVKDNFHCVEFYK